MLHKPQQALLWIALALAVVLRLASLGAAPLSGDEQLSATAQYLPAARLLAETGALASQVVPLEPPGFHLANRWTHVVYPEAAEAMFTAGGRAALRLLAALCGIGMVVLAYRLARRLSDPSWAWVAALVPALSVYGVYYSQENRSYMPVALAGLAATWLLIEIVAHGRRRLWPVYGALLALLGYLNYPALLVPLIHAAALAAAAVMGLRWGEGEDAPRLDLPTAKALAAAGVLALVLYAPWLPQAWAVATAPETVHPGWQGEPAGGLAAARTALAMWAHFGAGRLLSLLIYLPLAAAGLVAVWRKNPGAGAVLAAFYLVPTAAMVTLPYGGELHPRYMIFAFGLHQMLVGIGVATLARRAAGTKRRRAGLLAAVMLVVLFALNAGGLGEYYRYKIKCGADATAYADFCRTYIEP
jgi:4-amino-4-deoxy-L-arabinose transferase-like glycosyltransferase